MLYPHRSLAWTAQKPPINMVHLMLCAPPCQPCTPKHLVRRTSPRYSAPSARGLAHSTALCNRPRSPPSCRRRCTTTGACPTRLSPVWPRTPSTSCPRRRSCFSRRTWCLPTTSWVCVPAGPGPGPTLTIKRLTGNTRKGYTDTKCLVAATELGLADILAKGPSNVQGLAEASSARADRLGQILMPLRNNGIFSYDPDTGEYANTHVSTLLRSDHWAQWRNWVDLYGNEFYYIARCIPDSVRDDTTQTTTQNNNNTDMNMFEYFNARGWMPRLLRTLGGGATAMARGIVEDYPWSEVADKTVLDLGGGGGGGRRPRGGGGWSLRGGRGGA